MMGSLMGGNTEMKINWQIKVKIDKYGTQKSLGPFHSIKKMHMENASWLNLGMRSYELATDRPTH